MLKNIFLLFNLLLLRYFFYDLLRFLSEPFIINLFLNLVNRPNFRPYHPLDLPNYEPISDTVQIRQRITFVFLRVLALDPYMVPWYLPKSAIISPNDPLSSLPYHSPYQNFSIIRIFDGYQPMVQNLCPMR